jgi:hypothetical protein
MKPTAGRILLVRETELVRDDDGRQHVRVKRITPAIVTGVADDGSVSVQLFDRPTYSGLNVHDGPDELDQADTDAESVKHREAITAYWPAREAPPAPAPAPAPVVDPVPPTT